MGSSQQTLRALAGVIDRQLRESGINRRSAATTTGIPLTTLQRRLTGRSPFRVDELDAIAEAVGSTVSALMAEAEKEAAA